MKIAYLFFTKLLFFSSLQAMERETSELWQALYEANVLRVEKLLRKKRADPNERNEEGQTPLQYAIAKDSTRMALTILSDERTQLDACDAEGNTALRYAETTGNCTLLSLLLEYGADSARIKCLSTLSTSSLINQQLWEAVAQRNARKAQELLDQGANSDLVKISGRGIRTFILGQAALENDCPMINLLLEYGASINPENLGYVTQSPLQQAAASKKTQGAWLLVKRGAVFGPENPAADQLMTTILRDSDLLQTIELHPEGDDWQEHVAIVPQKEFNRAFVFAAAQNYVPFVKYGLNIASIAARKTALKVAALNNASEAFSLLHTEMSNEISLEYLTGVLRLAVAQGHEKIILLLCALRNNDNNWIEAVERARLHVETLLRNDEISQKKREKYKIVKEILDNQIRQMTIPAGEQDFYRAQLVNMFSYAFFTES